MFGDVAVGTALDDLETALALIRKPRGRRRLFEAFAAAEHVFQPQDKEDRNRRKDEKLDDSAVHRKMALAAARVPGGVGIEVTSHLCK